MFGAKLWRATKRGSRFGLVLALLGLTLESFAAESQRQSWPEPHPQPHPAPLHVAVASNFQPAMELLLRAFETISGHELTVSYGSTGKHFAQIVNGAPFDVFLAADVERPRRLEAEGYGVPNTRFTYAVGRLALWSPQVNRFADGSVALSEGNFRFLAMANPRTAPYGAAAEQVLRSLGAWEPLQQRIVRAENIGQAFGYVKSGNAELGFVALSQLAKLPEPQRGSTWLVPEHLHDPIEQQAIQLSDTEAASQFLDFLRSERAAAVICAQGYTLP